MADHLPILGICGWSGSGKTTLIEQIVPDLLAGGHQVLVVDVFMSGEFHPPFTRTERGESGGHFATYNQTTAACRVQDILTGLAYLQQGRADVHKVHLLGLAEAGPWCLLARALAHNVERTAVDFNRFKVDDDGEWMEQFFVPGVRSAGDVRTMLAMCAPAWLLVHNAGKRFPADWAQAAYRASGKVRHLQVEEKRARWADICAWLTQN